MLWYLISTAGKHDQHLEIIIIILASVPRVTVLPVRPICRYVTDLASCQLSSFKLRDLQADDERRWRSRVCGVRRAS